MKIIYNISTTASEGGGMERVIVEKANYLADNYNYDVIIVTTDQKDRPTFYPFSEKIRHINLDINYDEISSISNSIFSFYLYRIALIKHHRKLESLLMQEKADIVISLGRDEKEFLFKIKDGSKKILESHRCLKPRARIEYKRTNSILKRLKIIYRLLHETRIPKYYDKFILLTEEDNEFWKEKKNTIVIPNPLPFNQIQTALLDNKRVLSVGRISIEKGIDRLLNIWSKVSNQFPEWKLTLIGEVIDRELLTQIEELKIQSSVEVLPPTQLIKEEYLNSSIYVMTSRFEGFGMVLIEAMGCGVPNISYTFKCGPRDIISDGEDGFLVEEDDLETFVNKLILLMNNDYLRKEMGAKAKLNSQRFSVENVMEKWNNLFLELLKSSN